MRFLLLPLLSVMAWVMMPSLPDGGTPATAEKINLALRRTADNLLRQSGDSVSRIPAVQQISAQRWHIRLEQPFDYDALPATLQRAFDIFGIKSSYLVAVRQCQTHIIDLGFHKFDLVQGDSMVPCQGRDMPEGCHYIEVTFDAESRPTTASMLGIALLMLLPGLGIWWWVARLRRTRPAPTPPATAEPSAADTRSWTVFGQSRLDAAGQVLECGGEAHNLTFREAKLLRLFATNAGQLLEREQILQQVWADEGVMVGRSVDVFVSRLRKKLAADPTLSITAVHGVGYRLDVKMA